MALIGFGEPLPHLALPGTRNPRYMVASVAGRWTLLLFLPRQDALPREATAAAEAALAAVRRRLDDEDALFFLVVPRAEGLGTRWRDSLPGIRVLADPDGAALAACGGDPEAGAAILLDPFHRVLESGPFAAAPQLLARLGTLPPAPEHAGPDEVPAPVLVLPRVLEPEFCRRLIGLYDAAGGEASGFMREVDGRTVAASDPGFKRRSDHLVSDPAVLEMLRERIARRLLPAIHQAFQFQATRIERFLVACYDGGTGGFFRAHRDNTTRGTAHRRFAVTVNLNTEEFEGGELRFPEFGRRTYRAPTGGAVVFSCSLLHEALPVTRGRRYAFLPFLYDEAGARLRDQNLRFVGAPEPETASPATAQPAPPEPLPAGPAALPAAPA
ncbi:2OG-Fe(II) oxygenase family protein [Roseomonas sp. BN140053]|uniref:2OG-Fe(II) oxygenase family protein n=1 Tax=Roseomonas sp. BN140053 TaxID=3391898 RepID=UPI0039EAD7DD